MVSDCKFGMSLCLIPKITRTKLQVSKGSRRIIFLNQGVFYKKMDNKNMVLDNVFNETPIVSSRVGTPLFLRAPPPPHPPPFWVPPSFWSKFKKLPPSFWESSKLVHVNCKKHLKMKVLHFILYYVNWEYH